MKVGGFFFNNDDVHVRCFHSPACLTSYFLKVFFLLNILFFISTQLVPCILFSDKFGGIWWVRQLIKAFCLFFKHLLFEVSFHWKLPDYLHLRSHIIVTCVIVHCYGFFFCFEMEGDCFVGFFKEKEFLGPSYHHHKVFWTMFGTHSAYKTYPSPCACDSCFIYSWSTGGR